MKYVAFILVESQWVESHTIDAKSRRQAIREFRSSNENKLKDGTFKITKNE